MLMSIKVREGQGHLWVKVRTIYNVLRSPRGQMEKKV